MSDAGEVRHPLPPVTPIAYRTPDHLVLSAWTEHSPFGFWLIEALRPRVLVELGTHSGLSYFTFCQAARELGLEANFFAVDTWKGDEHAGFYAEEVFELVQKVNQERFSSFSQLLRSTFDDAADRFEDGTVDLLHLDGRHFYDDVVHDFSTWEAKLSDRAIVLFHDTNVRERGFGVHRAWAEIRERYPASVEFVHGHGLGVLQVGENLDPRLVEWFADHQEGTERLDELRASYSRLGRGVRESFELAQARDEVHNLGSRLAAVNDAVKRRGADIERLEARVRAESSSARVNGEKAAKVSQQLRATERRLAVAERDLAVARQAAERHAAAAAELEHRLNRLRGRRVVRAALLAGRTVRPLVKTVRRFRRGRRASLSEPSTADTRQAGEKASSVAQRAPRKTKPTMVAAPNIDGPPFRARLSAAPPVTVAIPIYNAPDELARCLESIERHTTFPAELVLIDDASTDDRVQDVLGPWTDRPNVRVLRNHENLGFTRTVNRAFTESSGDVVVLNSDTQVSPGWLQGLRRAAYEDPAVATVTPLSDNSGAFSVPEVGVANPVPPHLGVDGVGRLVAQTSLRARPHTPTGNGFCWYVKRSVIDDVGILDADAFPRGYGEENDFSMRAVRRGWRHIVDDATFVAHVREASFQQEKAQLLDAGRAVVDARYPEYTPLVRQFVHGEAMEQVRGRVGDALAVPRQSVLPRVLYIAQIGRGGTPATTRDLAGALSGWETFLFECDSRHIRLLRFGDTGPEVVEEHRLAVPVVFGERQHTEYDTVLAGVIRRYAIELVHIRHLIKQPLSAAKVASDLGVATVVSFHDYYFSCPTVHLLDESGRFCGGTCTEGQGRCLIPTPWVESSAPHLKHEWVHDWRDMVTEAFTGVDAFVTTSEASRDVMLRSLPALEGRRFEVIEHGRDLRRDALAVAPSNEERMRVLVPGNSGPHKGEELIRAIRALDTEDRLEFHFAGQPPAGADELGVVHGPYRRDDFPDLVRRIRPSIVAILSPWGETYCHTLTEAWALGLPVIACNEGALRERISRHGGGVLVSPSDPRDAYSAMLRLTAPEGRFDALVAEARAVPGKPIAAMADDYDDLYLDVMNERRRFWRLDRRRVGLLVAGGSDDRRWTGTAHIRIDRRYRHPRVREDLAASYLDGPPRPGSASDELQTVLVLRNGATGEKLRRLRSWVNARPERQVVLDLDDALTEGDMFPEGSPWRETADDIAELARLAGLVTVSTEPLGELIRGRYNESVAVLQNALDERLWFSPETTVAAAAEPDRPYRILYFGTDTHDEDLDLLQGAMARVQERLNRNVQLELVGMNPRRGEASWTRLAVPDTAKPYPAFVRWLRSNRHRWDVGVAPLRSGGFNDFKSDLKFLELSALGLPSAVSDVPAYRDTVEHGRTGLLVDDSSDAWVDAISSLFGDPDGAAQMAGRAQEHVRRARTIGVSAAGLRVALERALTGQSKGETARSAT